MATRKARVTGGRDRQPTKGTSMTRLILLAALTLAACAPAQVQQANKVITKGQLYCAKATAAGPLVVALADASGVPVNVIGQTSSAVQAWCAAIGAIPVIPPPNPAQAPVVAAPVSAAAK